MSRFTADGSGTAGGSGTECRLTRRSAIAGGAALVGAAGLGAPASAQTGLSGVIDAVDRWQETDLAGFELRIGGADEDDDDGSGEESSPQGTEGTAQDESGNATVAEGEPTVENPPTQTESNNETAVGESVEDATAQNGGGDGAGSAPQCDYQDWPPDEVAEYDAALINRKTDQGEAGEGSAPEESTTLYVAADEDVQEGEVYLINSFQRCDADYVGVTLEFLGESSGQGSAGADDANENVEDFEAQNNTGNGTEGVGGGGGGGDGGGGGGGGGATGSGSGPGFGAVGALVAAAGLGGLLAGRRQSD